MDGKGPNMELVKIGVKIGIGLIRKWRHVC